MSTDNKDISASYHRLMDGFIDGVFDSKSDMLSNGYYRSLSAPGFDEKGIAEISANCNLEV